MKRYIFLIFFLSLTIFISAQKGTLKIVITDIRSNKGNIKVALYSEKDKDWFLKSASKASQLKEVNIRNKKAYVIFSNIDYGTYAVSLFHDENNNGEFDRTSVGFPIEPFGISKNKLTIGPPKFKDGKFSLNSFEKIINIKMKTFL